MTEALAAGSPLRGINELTQRLLGARHFDARLSIALAALDEVFGITHTMMLVPNSEDSLSTLASHGYPPGGVGATVQFGRGAVGIAAERRQSIRLAHVQRGLNMLRAIHGPTRDQGASRNIPFVGIVNAQCQLAVPVVVGDQLLGVLYAEDTQPGKFTEEHTEVLQIVANLLAAHLLKEPTAAEAAAQSDGSVIARTSDAPIAAVPLAVRYYAEDSSVFFDGQYVIRSLPGAILWKLLRQFVEHGRGDFSSRELRLDPSLGSPAGKDNLDARLILLRRRLAERFPFVSITRTGRGRFVLAVDRTPVFEEA